MQLSYDIKGNILILTSFKQLKAIFSDALYWRAISIYNKNCSIYDHYNYTNRMPKAILRLSSRQ